MEPEWAIFCPQHPATCSCPEPDQSRLSPSIPFLWKPFHYYPPFYFYVFQVFFFFKLTNQNPACIFSPHTCYVSRPSPPTREEEVLWNSSLRSFIQPHFTFSLIYKNTKIFTTQDNNNKNLKETGCVDVGWIRDV